MLYPARNSVQKKYLAKEVWTPALARFVIVGLPRPMAVARKPWRARCAKNKGSSELRALCRRRLRYAKALRDL